VLGLEQNLPACDRGLSRAAGNVFLARFPGGFWGSAALVIVKMVLSFIYGRGVSVAGLILAALVLTGCSASHYRKSADKEVYGIIQNFEKQVFGQTNDFTIDTAQSGRNPKDIQAAEIIQDRGATNRRVLNLDQTLNLAVQNSREYQTQKEQLYLSALSLTGARYEFGPQFFAESAPQISGTPDGAQVGSIGNRMGVSQLLKTGGRLSVSLANDLVRYFTGKPSGDARNSAINTLSVDLTQPLLRGFGANSPLVEQLTQAERNVVYAVRAYSFYQQQFAVETVNTYFGLVTQKDIVRNNYRNYTNRVETTRYLEARAVDRERKSNVDDARTAELGARRDYINSLAAYLSAVDSFKLRLGIALSEELYLDDRDLEDLIKAGLTPVEIDRNAAFALCLEKQTEVLTAIDRFEDSKRKVRVAADRLRADVNVFGNATLSSEAPDDYLNFDPNKVRYTAGIRLNLPIDRLTERNSYRATLVSFESQMRSLALTLDNYRDRIDRGLRTIEQARLNYINGVESLTVAQRRVDNNSMLLEAGRATIRDLREAQDQLIQAQNSLSGLYAAYLAGRLGLLLNVGVIEIASERFWLQDPLEKSLAPGQRGIPQLRMPDDRVVPPEKFLEPSI
jgi:outer membrane protein TolC